MSVLDLARPEIRAMQPYSSARMEASGGDVFLNANESAWAPVGDDGLGCNRYPEPQPAALVDALAALYGVRREQLLVGRGSDEAIDLLVRAFCRAGRDAILIQPPTFGMYAVCARVQDAGVVEVPLAADFTLDVDAVLAALTPAVKLVFICTPNNPTGQPVPRAAVERLAQALSGRALLVVDEAYVEFCDAGSVADLIDRYDNLAVLRTLSKAWALAGVRIGSLLANAEVIALLRRIMAPYPLPLPSVDAALLALSGWGRANARGCRWRCAGYPGCARCCRRRRTSWPCASTMPAPLTSACSRPVSWCATCVGIRTLAMRCASPSVRRWKMIGCWPC